MKTSDLIGPALDWAVAKITNPQWWEEGYMESDPETALEMDDGTVYSPSTDWSEGGPIIEREGINLVPLYQGWEATIDLDEGDALIEKQIGPTPLVAAMRCYVASELGEEVAVPEELI